MHKYKGKPFRLSPRTRALIVIASRNCSVSETEIVERCLEMAMRKAVTKSAQAKALKEAVKIANAIKLAEAEIRGEGQRKLTPSCIRFKPEIAYLMGAAARIGRFTETQVLEACVESELQAAAMQIHIEDAELRNEDTASAFAGRLRSMGVDPTPYPRKTSYGNTSKRFSASAQSSEDAVVMRGSSSHIHELPGVGNIDKYVVM